MLSISPEYRQAIQLHRTQGVRNASYARIYIGQFDASAAGDATATLLDNGATRAVVPDSGFRITIWLTIMGARLVVLMVTIFVGSVIWTFVPGVHAAILPCTPVVPVKVAVAWATTPVVTCASVRVAAPVTVKSLVVRSSGVVGLVGCISAAAIMLLFARSKEEAICDNSGWPGWGKRIKAR